jgi:hypothetical protein
MSDTGAPLLPFRRLHGRSVTRLRTHRLAWFKSSYSSGEGGQCVEVARATRVHVRDSTRADGPVLSVGPAQWVEFVRMAARS